MNFIEWLLSASVLETVFGGVLGSVIGALVAMLVLWKSLKAQREALDEQLSRQTDHHQEQLRVQREENSRARLIVAVSEILQQLTKYSMAIPIRNVSTARREILDVRLNMSVLLERFHLEMDEINRPMYVVLSALIKFALREARPNGDRPHPRKRGKVLMELGGAIGCIITEWSRADQAGRDNHCRESEVLLDYLRTHDITEWTSALESLTAID